MCIRDRPYHHLEDGRFRNPEGSPVRSENIKWSYSTFNKEKKKLDMTVPEEHVIKKDKVLKKFNSGDVDGAAEMMADNAQIFSSADTKLAPSITFLEGKIASAKEEFEEAKAKFDEARKK